MQDLALIVCFVLLAVVITGPLSIWMAVKNYELGSLFMAALALMFGIFWFINVETSARFIGLCGAILGIVAIWYSVRLTRWW
jgi:ABC-type proline/glycine betaine transport system permease subunit